MQPEASRLEGRVDLQILLTPSRLARGGVSGLNAPVRLTHLRPLDLTWTRNLPAVADTLSVTLTEESLPVDDLRGLRGIRVIAWLYEHQQIDRCQLGDPGCFFGVVDEIGRGQIEGTLRLEARDMTSVALDAKVTPADLKKIDVTRYETLVELVRALLALAGAFAATWRVVPVSEAAGRSVYAGWQSSGLSSVRRGGAKKKPAAVAQRRLTTLDTLAEGNETAVWDTVCQVCARLGVVPELALGRDGVPEVLLVDALDLQTSDALRPFERAGRLSRSLTVGESVGMLDESTRFTRSSDLPDVVVVQSLDHETKQITEAAWPPDPPKGVDKPRISYQVAEGVAGMGALQKLAASAWAATRARQVEIEVETWSPWTDGGSPRDPDLLDCGAGAALTLLWHPDEIHQRRLRRQRLALDTQVLDRLEQAGRLQDPLFQILELTHTVSWDDSPEYTCKMKLGAYLGDLGGRP